MKKLVYFLSVIALTSVFAQLPTNGLIAYYPFNGTANDESGNGRNGIVYNAILSPDRFGNSNKAYGFKEATNAYIDIPNTQTLNLTSGGFSLCAWVNTTEGTRTKAIVGKHISGYNNGYYLGYRPATTFQFYLDSENGLTTSQSYNDGKWHFVVGTYDGTVMKIYVDGVFAVQQNKSYTNTNNANIQIGKFTLGTAAEYFVGLIDDIRIFNRALNTNEIGALFNETGTTPTTPQLIGYYPFNGNVNDESGNGRDGVNYNASFTTDRFGNANKAYLFNGNNAYIEIPNSQNLLNKTSLTLSAWVNFTENTRLKVIVGKHISGYGNGCYIMVRDATTFEFYVDSEYGLRTSKSYNDGQWHMVTGTFDGSIMKLYVDGSFVNQQNKTFTSTNTANILIGKHTLGSSADYFAGKIDEVRIYNYALSQSEINNLYTEKPTEIENEKISLPSKYLLQQNYPNPFNPETTIKYSIPENENGELQEVRLTIYDILGNEVVRLVNQRQVAGNYEVKFNGNDLSSGIYFYQLRSGSFVETRKFVLMK